MKTLIVSLLFSIFFSISALVSEYSLSILKKNTTNPPTLSQRLSFFYGWVKCNGESHFFVQKGYYQDDCDEETLTKITRKVQRTLMSTLGDKYNDINLVKVEGAGCFDNIKTLNHKKKKLLENKAKVIHLPI